MNGFPHPTAAPKVIFDQVSDNVLSSVYLSATHKITCDITPPHPKANKKPKKTKPQSLHTARNKSSKISFPLHFAHIFGLRGSSAGGFEKREGTC